MYKEQQQQSFEMDQQQPHQNSVGQDLQGDDGTGGGGGGQMVPESNGGVGGSMGSLGGTRIGPGGEMMYEGHGSLSGVPVSVLSAAQAAAIQQQQQALAAAAASSPSYRYMTLQSHPQSVAANHHPQMMPTGEYVYTSGPVGNHIVSQPLIYTTTGPTAHQQIAQQQVAVSQSYDRCPVICSLFAIFCCPITCWCSLPALAYSLCAYTDYRATDMHAYRRKSDVARRLVIIACLVGLILCICWAILTFLYYHEMQGLLTDIIRAVQRNVWPGGSGNL